MRTRVFLILLLGLVSGYTSFAQENGEYTQPRILILLDRSSSMIQPWVGGKEKYKIADEIIEKLMDSVNAVNDQVEFSLRVFGHQHTVQENDCTDTRNEVPFSKANRTRIQFRLEDIHPLGVTAIAYTLQEAALNDITDEAHNAYSIVLITDGGESCGGDICAVMEKLVKNKIYFKPYVLSLEPDPSLRREYSCVGNYLEVTKNGDITSAVNTIVEAYRPMLKLTKKEYKDIRAIAKAPEVPEIKQPAKADTMIIEPVKIKPKVESKRADTVVKVETPVPHTSHIKVDEVVARPPAIKMAKIPAQKIPKLFNGLRLKTKPEEFALTAPDIKVKEEIVRDAPVKLEKTNGKTISKIADPVVADNADSKTFDLTPPEIKTKPKREAAAAMSKIKPRPIHMLRNHVVPIVDEFKIVTLTAPEIKIKVPPPPPAPRPATPELTKVKLKHIKPYGHIFMLEETIPALVKLAPPEIKVKDVPPAGTVVKTVPKKTPKTGEYSVFPEPAKEVSVEVYLTNGKGKFFYATPKVVISDPVTDKEVRKFYRTVDANGNPDPQKNIAPGKYNLTVAGRDDLLVEMTVLPNMTTKVYIIVKDYSLFFTYAGAPDRPVKEFSAIVIQRNTTNGKVINQKCTEKLIYEPGNYHIIINTLPEDVRNVDLDEIGPGGIEIPQPGFAVFNVKSQATTVALYKELGDKFVSFYTLDLNDPKSKHLQIQPGKYQAHYQPMANVKFSTTEKVVPFSITSNKDTEVILK